MELYEYARSEVMSGKKILYVHGFASSGQSGTVRTIATLLSEAEIIAPDLPVRPEEALDLLKKICSEQVPDLIIGTSMGGMYAEQLYGFDRILVNPAFSLADTILKNNGLGRQDFHSHRQDGQSSFLVTKGLLEEFREASGNCFDEQSKDPDEQSRVYGLFGREDHLVDTFGIFAGHYHNAIRFNGEHYLNDRTFLHSVLPVIQRIDDKQQNRRKPVVFITLDDTLIRKSDGEPAEFAVSVLNNLSRHYDIYALIEAGHYDPAKYSSSIEWLDKHIDVLLWNRVVSSNHKDLLMGDYLVDANPHVNGGEDFVGTVIEFGSEHFKTWLDVENYFTLLGGQ